LTWDTEVVPLLQALDPKELSRLKDEVAAAGSPEQLEGVLNDLVHHAGPAALPFLLALGRAAVTKSSVWKDMGLKWEQDVAPVLAVLSFHDLIDMRKKLLAAVQQGEPGLLKQAIWEFALKAGPAAKHFALACIRPMAEDKLKEFGIAWSVAQTMVEAIPLADIAEQLKGVVADPSSAVPLLLEIAEKAGPPARAVIGAKVIEELWKQPGTTKVVEEIGLDKEERTRLEEACHRVPSAPSPDLHEGQHDSNERRCLVAGASMADKFAADCRCLSGREGGG